MDSDNNISPWITSRHAQHLAMDKISSWIVILTSNAGMCECGRKTFYNSKMRMKVDQFNPPPGDYTTYMI